MIKKRRRILSVSLPYFSLVPVFIVKQFSMISVAHVIALIIANLEVKNTSKNHEFYR